MFRVTFVPDRVLAGARRVTMEMLVGKEEVKVVDVSDGKGSSTTFHQNTRGHGPEEKCALSGPDREFYKRKPTDRNRDAGSLYLSGDLSLEEAR